MGATGRVLGDVATRLVYENDRVRIWELRLPPGAESPVHAHELDYVLVQIAGDKVAVRPEPDSGGDFREHLEADVVPGRAFFLRRGGIETAHNTGAAPYHEILIELKD